MSAPTPALGRRPFLARMIAAAAALAGLARARPAAAAPQGASSPYVGEVRMFAGDYAPVGWALCDGSLLPIAQHTALFSLIGTLYGGDGQTTFALPDLRGRAPMHAGAGPGLTPRSLAQWGGTETATMTASALPAHSHAAGASTAVGASADPAGRVPAVNAAGVPHYGAGSLVAMSSAALEPVGGSQAHNNVQPTLTVCFIIALQGVYPPQS